MISVLRVARSFSRSFLKKDRLLALPPHALHYPWRPHRPQPPEARQSWSALVATSVLTPEKRVKMTVSDTAIARRER